MVEIQTCISPEATCRSAIRAARDVATDLGPAADKVPGLLRIARCSESHSERDTHSVLANKMGLALPVPIHDVPLDASTESELKVLPTIRMRDWARYLVETNNWRRLAGLIRPDPAREQKNLDEFFGPTIVPWTRDLASSS